MARRGARWALVAAVGAVACALARTPVPARLEPAALPALIDDGDAAALAVAVARTEPVWRSRGDVGMAEAARRLLAALADDTDVEGRRAAVSAAFHVRRVDRPVLVTAYDEPEIAARDAPGDGFDVPVYGRPADLLDLDRPAFDVRCACTLTAGRADDGRVVPYATRAEIDAGALAGRGLELGWTDDAVELALLQVQGSGRLRFPDRVQPIGFAGSNGWPYRALGAILVDHGLLARAAVTRPAIRAALASLPPAQRRALLAENPRWIFFAPRHGPPVGSLGVALSAGRSIAADPALLPPATLAYLVTPHVRRLVLVQDTGAAVTGAHVDLFVGAGSAAAAFAGTMRDTGAVYVLVPR